MSWTEEMEKTEKELEMKHVEEYAQKYKSELKKIAEKMPWREIAETLIFEGFPEVNSYLGRLITEYKLLKDEVEGMEENPEAWVGSEDHPQTHVDALKKLLGVRK